MKNSNIKNDLAITAGLKLRVNSVFYQYILVNSVLKRR